MNEYKLTVGLEVHAELRTKTKMFCDSKNDPDETRPNVNICPICMAHPGTLPTINKEAVKHVLKVGVAVGGVLADFTEFDRKNYFYPDIPKGYQISQYKYPLVTGGSLAGVEITRVHLEEDTARSQHLPAQAGDGNFSLIDYNRAGVPLMELVTEPVIHDVETAVRFAKELQLLLRTIGAGEANLEKGEMRVEANISVSKSGVRGTKVEVKNLNSFRAVERAIQYEMNRHIKTLEEGGKIIQETRGWDEAGQKTFSQRLKENSHDYRYFPDPDLPKLYISKIPEFSKEVLQKELPELPSNKRERFMSVLKLKNEDAEMLVADPTLGPLFDEVAKILGDENKTLLAANYITSDIAGLMKNGGSLKFTAKELSSVMEMLSMGELSSRGAKDIIAILFTEGGDPEKIAKEKDLIQKSDDETLIKIAQSIIEKNQNVVAEYKAGKESSLQFLVGQGMKESRGSANPGKLKEIIIANIK